MGEGGGAISDDDHSARREAASISPNMRAAHLKEPMWQVKCAMGGHENVQIMIREYPRVLCIEATDYELGEVLFHYDHLLKDPAILAAVQDDS